MKDRSDQLRELRAILVQRLESVQAASDAAAESRRPVELDQTSVGRLSRMDALQMQAMAHAAEGLRFREAERIKATIARIDAGEYGYCVVCGEEIAPKRLAVDPTIATCIRCASRSGG
jgi:DnaK suppressor protein